MQPRSIGGSAAFAGKPVQSDSQHQHSTKLITKLWDSKVCKLSLLAGHVQLAHSDGVRWF
jgi:hypothetical protein